jgi:DNA invertase Pin-like site-specific DNA recombinase
MHNSNIAKARRCFGYVRASTAAQDDSLELQKQRIEAIARAEGLDLVEVFTDAATSGGIPLGDREQGKALLAAVRHGDVIVALKLDRVFRDVSDAVAALKTLRKRGVGLILKDLGSGDLTESNVSALVFALSASVADFERSRIGERIREAKTYQKAQGRFLGGRIPFGYSKAGRVEDGRVRSILVPREAIHEEARRLRDQGYSARLAAGHFRAIGHSVSASGVRALWPAWLRKQFNAENIKLAILRLGVVIAF